MARLTDFHRQHRCLFEKLMLAFVDFFFENYTVQRRQSQHARTLLTVKFRQPSHEFIFSVGMSFISYPLVLTPLV
jgi:hypothetical protein